MVDFSRHGASLVGRDLPLSTQPLPGKVQRVWTWATLATSTPNLAIWFDMIWTMTGGPPEILTTVLLSTSATSNDDLMKAVREARPQRREDWTR